MSTIMIVEDDTQIRNVLAEVLEDEGYTTLGAANGSLALQALASTTRPDLIITDIMMPVMDGLRLCASVQADPATAGIPIMLMSAGNNQHMVDGCRCAAFLAKPFQITTVLDLVSTVLNRNS
jgi:CheY-like chemotaxis protein